MRLAIVGYGVEGQSAARYWGAKGAEITICDVNSDLELPEGAKGQLGPDYLDDLDQFDLIVRSPGTRPDAIRTTTEVTSVTREFLARCHATVIGVTGTKGKGTTSSLISRILEADGHKVWLGGNIGQPPLDFLDQVKPNDYVVLELSSYQLMDVARSPNISVCLMIAPDHMNWHGSMEEYVAAKGNIFRFQGSNDLAVYYPRNRYSRQLGEMAPGRRRPYGQAPGAEVRGDLIVMGERPIMPVAEVGLIGPHNLENICAAISATWELVKQEPEPLRRAITAFKGLEHRLQLVGEVDGVSYYDDSFATTPETAMAAIASFAAPKVVILGGSNKGVEYKGLAQAVADGNVIHALLIGDMAPTLARELGGVGFSHFTQVQWKGMEALVKTCRQITHPGDVVLLSPGCASFGLFKDYKERGSLFAAAVTQLKGGSS